MKKVFLLLFVFSTSIVFSQKKHHQKPDFSIDQHVQLIVKKLSIGLELNDNQIAKITPIVKAKFEKREALKNNKAEATSTDEKFNLAMDKLNDEAALQKQMKKILNKDQYETWKKIHMKHMHKRKKMRHGKSKNKHMAQA